MQNNARLSKNYAAALAPGGVILFTAGGDRWADNRTRCAALNFYYSSLDEEEYLKVMKENGCKCILMERDQYPAEHTVFIGAKEPIKS